MSEKPPSEENPSPGEGNQLPEETPEERLKRLMSESQSMPEEEPVDADADTQPYQVSPPVEPVEDLPDLNNPDQDLVQTIGMPADPGGVPFNPELDEPDLIQTIPMSESGDLPDLTVPETPLPPADPFSETQPNIYLSSPEEADQEPPDWSEQPTIPPPPGVGSDELPRRVEEQDMNATRVTPAAYNYPARPRSSTSGQGTRPGSSTPHPRSQTEAYRPKKGEPNQPGNPPLNDFTRPVGTKPPRGGRPRRRMGCFWRGVVITLFIAVIIFLLAASIGVFEYFRIATSLPDVSVLRQKASQFETTRIFDRNGNVLYEINDPNAGRRTYVPLGQISPNLVAATIATEDKAFYSHPGFDPLALLRALWVNYTTGGQGGGASTITQQLARALLLSPQERYERTLSRKAREIILAAEITRRYSKDEILELYLNEVYYSNLAYGIEAAAETYFNTTASQLTLGQAAFLAGLPQSPGVYDIYTNGEQTMLRMQSVLILMYQLSKEENCIHVSNSDQPVCVDEVAASNAYQEILSYNFKQNQQYFRFPHWVVYVRSLLESMYDPQEIYRSGFNVYTTIDPGLQDAAEKAVSDQLATLQDRHVTDGAVIALKPSTGEILAMVGSADFNNADISGQVNMAISPRQPGSAIKPLTYVAAFEKGWTPSTLIWDVPSEFPPSGLANDPMPPYVPENYDGRFHGPVTVRTALANSYNIPAVKALQFVGVYGDPSNPQTGGLVNFAKRLGITTLTRTDYGLALTLGGGEVSLLELTSAYGVFADGGKKVAPVAITKITDYTGKVIFEYKPPEGEQVVRPEHAYLISSILSDNAARTPAFGANSVLNLPFEVAVKTGTTNDFRDNWTVGYTPDVAVGVWVGNADFTPMEHTTGVTGAAPIWAQVMQSAVQSLTGGNPTQFSRPSGVVEKVICSVSGTEPSEWCPSQRSELFAADQPPLPATDDLWGKVKIDTWTGLEASQWCSEYTEDKFVLNVTDPGAVKWISETDEGKQWAESVGFSDKVTFKPQRQCQFEDPHPTIMFAGMTDHMAITTSPLDIYLVASATADFKSFQMDYGIGENPVEWKPLFDNITVPYTTPEKIISWDLADIPTGIITVRVHMVSILDTYAEKNIRIDIQVPTATPTLTPTMTATPTITVTPTPTVTVTPSPPPTETLTPTVTPPGTTP